MLLINAFCVLAMYYTVSVTSDKYHILTAKKADKFEVVTEAAIRMLETCADEKLSHICFIKNRKTSARGSNQMKSRAFSVLKLDPVSNESRILSGGVSNVLKSHFRKIDIFVIVASSATEVHDFIQTLKSSIWWNYFARYLILDSNTARTGCDGAQSYLWIAWKFDLVSSTFLCLDENEGLTLYTYNPYTSYAPNSWEKVGTFNTQKRQHTWTLFKRLYSYGSTDVNSYLGPQNFVYHERNPEVGGCTTKTAPVKHEGGTACKDLNFDKTANLGGYKIKALAIHTPPTLVVKQQRTGAERLGGMDGIVAQTLWNKLNATLVITPVMDSMINFGYVESDGVAHGFLRNITTGDHDLLLNMQFIFNKPNLTMTYPHIDSGISVLSRYVGFETEMAKILKFMNVKVIIGILLVSVSTVICLGVFAGHGLSKATTEIVQLMVGSSLPKLPRRQPLRIFLMTVIFLFFITGSTFQSNLSSILTSTVCKPNVDSINALKRSGLTIYAFEGYEKAFFDPVLISRLKVINHWNCSKYVIEREGTACAADRAKLMKIAFENNLHLSKHRICTLYAAYAIRRNWPLTERVNMVLRWMSEAGLFPYWMHQTVAIYKRKWMIQEREMSSRTFRIMTLEDLGFAFYILLFGLSCASVVFVIEIGVNRYMGYIKRKNKEGGKMHGNLQVTVSS